jgi:hypothetical protein
MKKPHPEPVVIDNWPHPPIVLEQPRTVPKRICGVFVIRVSHWPNELCLARGKYFSSTRAASNAMGFDADRVGALLRKNRGTNLEGRANFHLAWFMSAKEAIKRHAWHHDGFLRYAFPWYFENIPPRSKLAWIDGKLEIVPAWSRHLEFGTVPSAGRTSGEVT